MIGDLHHGDDTIRSIGSYTSFAQVQNHFSQSSGDLGDNKLIALNGVSMSTLTASYALFE